MLTFLNQKVSKNKVLFLHNYIRKSGERGKIKEFQNRPGVSSGFMLVVIWFCDLLVGRQLETRKIDPKLNIINLDITEPLECRKVL